MELILVRHAIAFDRDPNRWPDDRERPLTSEGRRRFQDALRGLPRVIKSVDRVYVSPLTRARQTAELLADKGGWPRARLLDALEPHRAPSELLDALAADLGDPPLPDRIALVGHEPHLSTVATHLLTGQSAWPIFEMKKGGIAAIRFPGAPKAGAGSLYLFLPPRLLRALA